MKNTKGRTNQQDQLDRESASSQNNSFDFDLWASEVRQQLIDVIKKRNVR